MLYKINVAKKYKTENRGGELKNLYRHYFKIETEMLYEGVKELVLEMQEKYPAPDYDITLTRRTTYEEVVA